MFVKIKTIIRDRNILKSTNFHLWPPKIQKWTNPYLTLNAPIATNVAGFYTKLNVWGSLGLNFEYDGGPIIEIGGPIFLYQLRILEGSTSFREGSVLSPGQ